MNKKGLKEINFHNNAYSDARRTLFNLVRQLDSDKVFELENDAYKLEHRINKIINDVKAKIILKDCTEFVEVVGRYGNIYPLGKKDDFTWVWVIPSSNHCRRGWDSDPEDILFVDPEGGPMVSVGSNLKFFHHDLPEEFVEKIWFDKELETYIFETTNVEVGRPEL